MGCDLRDRRNASSDSDHLEIDLAGLRTGPTGPSIAPTGPVGPTVERT